MITIDVDLDDIIYAMAHSKSDRRKFFKAMQEEGCISELCTVTNDGTVLASPGAERINRMEVNEALQSLYGKSWRMSLEEEQFIINLAKKYD